MESALLENQMDEMTDELAKSTETMDDATRRPRLQEARRKIALLCPSCSATKPASRASSTLPATPRGPPRRHPETNGIAKRT